MLKKRVIPILLLKNNKLVKSINFKNFQYVGNPLNTSVSLYKQDADEICILNIDSKDDYNINNSIDILKTIIKNCFIPITYGGNLKNFEDISFCFDSGIDKVALNSICYSNTKILEKVVQFYGSQALTAVIDFKIVDGNPVLFSSFAKIAEKISLEEHVCNLLKNGVSEIIFQNIDNDGKMSGCEYLNKLNLNRFKINKIVVGGIGNYGHALEIFSDFNVEAIGCGSLFSFSDSNPIRLKSFLKNNKVLA
tara:strand:- start:20899 stop:21648 length:750 start_codon:yes stop_codon:yes gene_type:complete